MTKSFSDIACEERGTHAPSPNSNSPKACPVMDERGRTVAWVTRTVHRLYNIQTQKILDLKEISIAHWFYLRVESGGASDKHTHEQSLRVSLETNFCF